MTLLALTSLLFAWLLGLLLVVACWPAGRPLRSDAPLILPLGAMLGLGLTSALFFGASLVSARPALLSGVGEALLIIALAWSLRRRPPAPPAPVADRVPLTWLDWILATSLVQAAVVAGVVVARAYAAEPYGGWDGWAIWNLHARFMLRAGPGWTDALTSPQLSWSHPDYPWLVPASVARVWSWSGAETPFAAAAVSVVFAIATVVLLVAAVAKLRGRTAALLAGLVLAGTPFFVTFAPNQHADIPLALCVLATGVLLALGRHFFLAGLCAALAAWTKNEGMLFATIAALAVALQARRDHARGRFGCFVAGLIIGAAPVIYFKLAIAPPNDLAVAPLGPRLAHLLDGARHTLILATAWRDLRQFGEWTLLPFAAMALPFAAWRWRPPLADARALPVLLGAMLAGFYVVYLLSPQDLAWHLDTSLVRLLLQLWPLALFWWALALPLPPAQSASADQRWTRRVFVGANALAAVVLIAGFATQLAPNELAVRRQGGGVVSVALGDGWFGVEQHGRDRWAWSKGDATLRLDASGSPRPITLRCALRSLGPRTVTIRAGDRVLWSGAVADKHVAVAVTLPVPAKLEFSTDAPAVAESTAPGARPLAFAISRVTID